MEKTNIAFTGVADYAFRDSHAEEALSGKVINNDSIHAAVSAALQHVDIMSDRFASKTYRKHLAKVYLKKGFRSSDIIFFLPGKLIFLTVPGRGSFLRLSGTLGMLFIVSSIG
jgi:hypothetical protein